MPSAGSASNTNTQSANTASKKHRHHSNKVEEQSDGEHRHQSKKLEDQSDGELEANFGRLDKKKQKLNKKKERAGTEGTPALSGRELAVINVQILQIQSGN
jgi:hypothetical protein